MLIFGNRMCRDGVKNLLFNERRVTKNEIWQNTLKELFLLFLGWRPKLERDYVLLPHTSLANQNIFLSPMVSKTKDQVESNNQNLIPSPD